MHRTAQQEARMHCTTTNDQKCTEKDILPMLFLAQAPNAITPMHRLKKGVLHICDHSLIAKLFVVDYT
jgi:hypothetical protein